MAHSSRPTRNGGDLGFEATLWQAADKLRGNLDASDYKHVVLGLIFLKYISDAFEEKRAALAKDRDADPEDRDEYLADNVFWVPTEARWAKLQAAAKQPTIGKTLDDAMTAIERDNSRLKGVLPKEYARPALDKRRLGELIDLIAKIGLGDVANRSKDILGRVYEYFLGQFASAEGKKGGEFYTPRSVVRLLVEMLAPHDRARIYDPCCGSGGMFVQSERFIEAHGGRRGAAAIFGQESNHTTWRLCQMNLAIRGIEGHIELGDTFHDDRHRDLKPDFVLANPPFNVSDWGGDGLRDAKDPRWNYGVPPASNANFAWVQVFIHHLGPKGAAGFVLANGSTSGAQSGEGEIRQRIVEAGLVDCIVALPGKLFYSTQIPVCLWFLRRDRRATGAGGRGDSTLFIDARSLGHLVDKTHLALSAEDVSQIAFTYHRWRGQGAGEYKDVPGFCRSAPMADIRNKGFVLSPARYVGAQTLADRNPGEFEAAVNDVLSHLRSQRDENARLAPLVDERARNLSRMSATTTPSDAEITTLGALVSAGRLDLNDGYRTRQSELGIPGIPILRVADVQDGAVTPSNRDHVRNEYRPLIGSKLSRAGDVVVTTKGTVGRVARITKTCAELVYSPQLCYFRATSHPLGPDADFLYFWLRGPEFRAQLDALKSQTDMADYVNLGDMRAIRITIPSAQSRTAIVDFLGALEDKIAADHGEAQQLRNLQDELLPRLLDGTVSIPRAPTDGQDAVR